MEGEEEESLSLMLKFQLIPERVARKLCHTPKMPQMGKRAVGLRWRKEDGSDEAEVGGPGWMGAWMVTGRWEEGEIAVHGLAEVVKMQTSCFYL